MDTCVTISSAKKLPDLKTGGPDSKGKWGVGLYLLAPYYRKEWTLLGELDKYVSFSKYRFFQYERTPTGLSFYVIGTHDEVINLTLLDPKDKVLELQIKLVKGESARVSLENSSGSVMVLSLIHI
eukprot:TRINITY_DN2350_c0_g2_i2.p1 TRINITY_DN2350_c0_g2~~TRINITY_DN2350_c0_g2_i2.p1  ORF type:complete len:125 (+),score=11.75 TRINITY_DN2350_c0_g2_i2:57-431(+)